MQGIHSQLLYQSLRGIQEGTHPLDVSALPIGVREAAFVEAVGCFAAFIAKAEVHIILQTSMPLKCCVACMSKRTSWQTLCVCILAHADIDLRLAMPDDVQMSCLSPRSCLLCHPEACCVCMSFISSHDSCGVATRQSKWKIGMCMSGSDHVHSIVCNMHTCCDPTLHAFDMFQQTF